MEIISENPNFKVILSVTILLYSDYVDCIKWSTVENIKDVLADLTSEPKNLQFYWCDIRLLVILLLRYINRIADMPKGTTRKEHALIRCSSVMDASSWTAIQTTEC